MSSLKIAGVEQALVNYINFLNDSFPSHQIHLYLLKKEGELLNELNSNCLVHEIIMDNHDKKLLFLGGFKESIKYYLKRLKILSALRIAFRRIVLHRIDYDLINFEKIESITNQFDVAICYMAHMPFLIKYVISKVTAKQKSLFIHSDFVKTGYRIDYFKKYITLYENFCCVSKDLEKQFLNIYPELKSKTCVIHNFFPYKKIILNSNKETIQKDANKLNLLTVGNFTKEKGYDIAIKTANILKSRNINFCWTMIGDGKELKKMLSLTKKWGLSDYLVFKGKLSNPYPYYKACDLYVQTSKTEGYCTTVVESKLFNNKIITTNAPGMKEILTNYKQAIICDSFNPTTIADQIVLLSNYSGSKSIFDPKEYNNTILKISKTVFNL